MLDDERSPTWATTSWTCRCSRASGLSAAPADAVDEVRSARPLGQPRRGGDGAARELIELILRAQGRWDGDRRDVSGDAQDQQA